MEYYQEPQLKKGFEEYLQPDEVQAIADYMRLRVRVHEKLLKRWQRIYEHNRIEGVRKGGTKTGFHSFIGNGRRQQIRYSRAAWAAAKRVDYVELDIRVIFSFLTDYGYFEVLATIKSEYNKAQYGVSFDQRFARIWSDPDVWSKHIFHAIKHMTIPYRLVFEVPPE